MDLDLFPPSLPVVATANDQDGGPDWLARLPSVVEELRERWSLRIGAPFHGGSCSWVAPVWRPDGEPAVLKVTWPHREAMGEAEGLRLWSGRGAVLLFEEDRDHLAVLIERCEPGVTLAESAQLTPDRRLLIGAQLLYELWSVPLPQHTGLESLADVTAEWADLVETRMARFKPDFDPGLVALAAKLLRELPRGAAREVVVHGDFNPGNILSAQRKPWLVIDAKPMIGDPGYDVWPLVSQIDDPFAYDDAQRILTERMTLVAGMAGEDVRRLAAWALAREIEAALWRLEHPDTQSPVGSIDKARALAKLAEL
ncbi:aminoglycoside phosphotransferase family protein [Actinocrinis sp.]|uniref:aminoglycoside phosphotransferase family protein n=1 Tax=Actinocrinis sp. TaxID=1920516 RepID=UPI002C91AF61|nr:aminoglycoside phosphotransferase family protein [Actinocrinis sp.]HXR70618.1 aminoglycoside phosphotransferase family protein [Actinocrinis sp.]